MVLHLDYETRSTCPLPKAGAHVYSEHPDTDIWLASYAFDDEDVETWYPGEPVPYRIYEHIGNGHPVWAHNASFEYLITNNVAFKKYHWPKLELNQLYCTQSLAYAMAIPASLEREAPAMGIEQVKDSDGSRLMMQMCQPRAVNANGTIIWWDQREKIERLAAYGRQDVVVERELKKRLMMLSSFERDVWLLDQKINNRGVQIAIDEVKKAIAIVDAEQERLDSEMRMVTGGAVGACTCTAQLADWVRAKGIEVEGVAKADVLMLLDNKELPSEVRHALKLRQSAAKSSTKKLEAMVIGSGSDGRSRGLFQYHGAGTGRWAGRRIQLQNLPRPALEQDAIEEIFEILKRIL